MNFSLLRRDESMIDSFNRIVNYETGLAAKCSMYMQKINQLETQVRQYKHYISELIKSLAKLLANKSKPGRMLRELMSKIEELHNLKI